MSEALDTFAGTGALSASWTNLAGAASRVAGIVTPSSAPAAYYWNATAFSASQYVQVTLAAAPASESNAFARLTTGFNGYFVGASGTSLVSARADAGVPTTLETLTGYTFVSGNTIGIDINGSFIRIYYNGIPQGTGKTDATYSAAANVGFSLNATGDTIRGFFAADLRMFRMSALDGIGGSGIIQLNPSLG